MRKPRTITQAWNEGYIIKKVILGRFGKNRIDMSSRFPNRDMKSVISFWITYIGCKRLGIKEY